MAEPIKITLLGDADQLADTLADAGEDISAFGDMAKGLAVAAGGAIALGIGAGIMEALSQEADSDLLAAQLGASPAEAERLGKAAGEVYSAGYGESVADANEALKNLWQQGLVPAGATADEMANISKQAMDVSTVLGDEVGPTANAVGQMLKTGMAKNATEAFDILVAGTQNGANKAQDLLDTFNEYSTSFRTLGLDGKTAMGLISQGLQGGARDADQVADALKEFSLVAGQGGDAINQTFASIGLNGDQITKDVNAGGKAASEALGSVLAKLSEMPDGAAKANAVKTLFGGPGEDLGAALFSLNVDKATDALGKVDGAAAKAGDTMHDNAANKVKEFTRSLQQGVVDFLGTAVVPAVEALADKLSGVGSAITTTAGFISQHSTTFGILAGVITTLILPALIAWGVQQVITGAQVVAGWVTTAAASVTSAATQVAASWSTVGGWIAAAARALVSGAVIVGMWVLMGAQALIQAAVMASAWLVAFWPVALVIAAVIGLALIIWKNWDTIKKYTLEAFEWVWEKIKTVFDFVKNLFLNFTGPGLLIKHWDTIRNATTNAFKAVQDKAKAGLDAVVGFVKSLPGRLLSAASSLMNAGRAIGGRVVDGLNSGLSRLGGFASSLASTVTRATKGAINGVIDLLNWAIPNKLGWGSLSIDLPDSPIPKIRAMGGPAGGPTWVGERGRELVNLPQGSTVIPNHAAGNGAGVVVNVQTNADPYAIGREVAWALRTSPA
ncbi:phage tail tape measure protein [Streptomyces sp. NPDC091267]|uniref:phage tail tape measure protein n=1 Tax=Streptomyces sp. NPDC091267 TaxID=3155195 RepID=UPI00342D40AD